ncbi:MAG TPA: short-chain dehydrogenase [Alcaligenaceae bacterium]|nr:short-chain dehydrogenase [Alcaligenaceae bacterium]
MSTPLPPSTRSAAAAGLTTAAENNTFALQVCSACQTVQYPPRDVCSNCLHDDLPWQAVPQQATVMASSTLRHSNEPYFQEQLPWRIATVKLDCGPVAIAHLKDDLQTGDRTELALELDAAGVGVLVAYAPNNF